MAERLKPSKMGGMEDCGFSGLLDGGRYVAKQDRVDILVDPVWLPDFLKLAPRYVLLNGVVIYVPETETVPPNYMRIHPKSDLINQPEFGKRKRSYGQGLPGLTEELGKDEKLGKNSAKVDWLATPGSEGERPADVAPFNPEKKIQPKPIGKRNGSGGRHRGPEIHL
jgi:hypothetical protein